MSEASRKGTKSILKRIVDSVRKEPLNMADGRGAGIPTIQLFSDPKYKSNVEKAVEQGFEVRSHPKTPNDTFLGHDTRRTKETIEKFGSDEVRDSGVFELPINELGHRNPRTGYQEGTMKGFIWDKKGYAQEVPRHIQVPLYADKGVDLGIMKDVKKPERLGGKTKKEIFDDLINSGRDYEPNARAKARGEYVTKPTASTPRRTDAEVAEKAIGDIAKVGLAGGTAAGAAAVGRSLWSQQKDKARGGQK
jgi:hypothetical protein